MIKHNAIRAISTLDLTNEQWQDFRRSGIGGSDIAGICGLSKWSSPIDIYLSKVNGSNVEENERMYWGKQLEAIVADEFAKRHPEYRVEKVNAILRHPEHSFAIANLDRMIESPEEGAGVLEVKTSGQFAASSWADGVPIHYQAQGMWYLAVTGLSYVWFAVLIGGQEYREIKIVRDEAAVKALLDTGSDFWESYVIPKLMPAPVVPGDLEAVKGIFSAREDGESLEVDNDLGMILHQFDAAKTAAKLAEESVDLLQAKVIAALGDHEFATGNGWKVTYKANKDSLSLNAKAFEAAEPERYKNFIATYPTIRKGARPLKITKVEA